MTYSQIFDILGAINFVLFLEVIWAGINQCLIWGYGYCDSFSGQNRKHFFVEGHYKGTSGNSAQKSYPFVQIAQVWQNVETHLIYWKNKLHACSSVFDILGALKKDPLLVFESFFLLADDSFGQLITPIHIGWKSNRHNFFSILVVKIWQICGHQRLMKSVSFRQLSLGGSNSGLWWKA